MTKDITQGADSYLSEQLDLEADFGAIATPPAPPKANGHDSAPKVAITTPIPEPQPEPDIEREAIVQVDGDKPDDQEPVVIDPSAPWTNAHLMIEREYTMAGVHTLCHQQSVFMAWTGSRYKDLAKEEVRAETYGFLSRALVEKKKSLAPHKPTSRGVTDVIDALRSACQLPVDMLQPNWIRAKATNPPPQEVISCKNGLLHLPTGKILPHTPNFFSSTALSFDYVPIAPAPLHWLAFLKTIWGTDAESIATLQEIFGYLLGSETDQQKLFMIVGPKRSGKGTIARVLNTLLGEDSVISPTLASLQGQFGIAPLIGKSVALIADARLGSKPDQQSVIAERLLSISGEDKQSVDRKFIEPWSGRLGVRFLIMSNELPRISDASGALTSRFVILTMTRSFYGKEDRGLAARLLTEMSGILNWAIEGWRNLRKRGHFVQPKAALGAIKDLEDLSSPVAAFFRDKCDIGPGHQVGVESLYLAWVDWCTEQGRDKPGTKQSFGRDLRTVKPEMEAVQIGPANDRHRVYEGIGLKKVIVNKEENSRNHYRDDEF